MKTFARSAILTLSTFLFLVAPAHSNREMGIAEEKQAIAKEMKESWRSSTVNPGEIVGINCKIADDGWFYDPVIDRFSGDDQYDAECFETFCSLAPLKVSSNSNSRQLQLKTVYEAFGNGPGLVHPELEAPEIKEFRKTHSLKPGSVIIHKIPMFVAERYPTLVDKREILSQKNLFVVEPSDFDGRTSNINIKGPRNSEPCFVQAIRSVNSLWSKRFPKEGQFTKEKVAELTNCVDPHLWQ